MRLKKNVFSYVLWFLYTIMTGSGLFCLVNIIGNRVGSDRIFALFIGAGIILVALGVSVLSKKFLCLCLERDQQINIKIFYVIYSLLIAVLVVAGFLLRQGELMAIKQIDPYMYFEQACVRTGSQIVPAAHGIEDLYIRLLRLLCIVFGNYEYICLQVQIVIQLMGGLVFCEAVRRMTGPVPALFMFVFFAISDLWIQEATIFSCTTLFFVIFSSVWLAISLWYKGKEHGIWSFMLLGAMSGILIYFDLTGIVVLVALLYAFAIEAGREENQISDTVYLGLLGLSGVIFAVAACVVVDGVFCGIKINHVVSAWFQVYCQTPGFTGLSGVFNDGNGYVLVLLAVSMIGAVSFFLHKKSESMNLWVIVSVLLVVADCFGIVCKQPDVMCMLTLMVAVLAGIGVMNLYDGALEKLSMMEEKDVMGKTIEDIAENKYMAKEENDGIQFLENPLPLPKKHEKKVMDYDYYVSDDDDFDVE